MYPFCKLIMIYTYKKFRVWQNAIELIRLRAFVVMHIYSWGVLFSRIFSAHFSSLSLPVSSPFPSLTIFSFNSGCGDCGHAAGFTGRLGDAVFKFVFFLQLFTFYRATLPSALLHIISYDHVHAHPSDCSSDIRRSLCSQAFHHPRHSTETQRRRHLPSRNSRWRRLCRPFFC